MKRLIFNLLFVAAAVVCGILLGRQPWQKYFEVRHEAHLQIEQMKRAEARRSQEVIDENRYQSTSGREELAREQGYRKAGEIPVQ